MRNRTNREFTPFSLRGEGYTLYSGAGPFSGSIGWEGYYYKQSSYTSFSFGGGIGYPISGSQGKGFTRVWGRTWNKFTLPVFHYPE